MDNKTTYINGPINYIKLKNKKTNNIVWILMDIHENLEYQKKCEEYEAKDIDKFLFKELNESKEQIDFFLEIDPTDINYTNTNHINEKFLLETKKIFVYL